MILVIKIIKYIIKELRSTQYIADNFLIYLQFCDNKTMKFLPSAKLQ
jgi:hypothetical protein